MSQDQTLRDGSVPDKHGREEMEIARRKDQSGGAA